MYCVDLVVADGLISILSFSFLSKRGFDRVVGVLVVFVVWVFLS